MKKKFEQMSMHPIDMTGRVFGRWTVLRYVGNRLWLCECSCPKKGRKEIDGRVLRRGFSHSCGCLRSETNSANGKINGKKNIWKAIASNVKYSKEEYSDRIILKHYKNNSKIKNLNFNISFEDFRKYIHDKCFYCGTAPSTVYTQIRKRSTKTTTTVSVYNGIDRIDTHKGYELGNLVTCCPMCNYFKRGLSEKDFIEWVRKVYNRKGLIIEKRDIVYHNEKSLSSVYSQYKSRKKVFCIEKPAFYKIINSNCFYCGSLPSNLCSKSYVFPPEPYNGLDRVDNSKGYTEDNVVPCCAHCNRAKNNYTQEEFYDHIAKIYMWNNEISTVSKLSV